MPADRATAARWCPDVLVRCGTLYPAGDETAPLAALVDPTADRTVSA